ncbi:MAG TPA: hypothetical protein VIL34_03880 [Actinopolymorphaceae bacterium]
MRRVVSGLLVLLSCAAAAFIVPVRWLDAQLHTDAYVETVSALPSHPDVQQAVVDLLLDALEASGRPVSPGVTGTLQEQIPLALSTPEVTKLWVSANLKARDAVLSGRGTEVAVDVSTLLGPIRQELSAEGVELPAELPEESSRVVLVDHPSVVRARDVSQFVGDTAPLVPVPSIVLLALAVIVSRRRWWTVAFAGVGMMLVALADLAALDMVENRVLAEIDSDSSRSLALAGYETFARSLQSDLVKMLIASGIVALLGTLLAVLAARRRSAESDESVEEVERVVMPTLRRAVPPRHRSTYAAGGAGAGYDWGSRPSAVPGAARTRPFHGEWGQRGPGMRGNQQGGAGAWGRGRDFRGYHGGQSNGSARNGSWSPGHQQPGYSQLNGYHPRSQPGRGASSTGRAQPGASSTRPSYPTNPSAQPPSSRSQRSSYSQPPRSAASSSWPGQRPSGAPPRQRSQRPSWLPSTDPAEADQTYPPDPQRWRY